MGTKPLYTFVCKHCGSNDCGRDALVTWDTVAQDWVVVGTLDSTWCNSCDEDDAGLLREEYK